MFPMDGFHYYRAQLDEFPDPEAWVVQYTMNQLLIKYLNNLKPIAN